MTRSSALAAALLALVLPLAGCGSDKPQRDPQEVLAAAKKNLDQARSVHLTLMTKSVPPAGNGVLGADGTLTHQPAYEGTVRVLLGGFNAEVPVVSVGGKVHAKLPATTKYAVIDPAEYGAPDPADFIDPDTGIPGLLANMQGARATGERRQGSQVLSTYTGRVNGARVKPIIPSADAKGSYRVVAGIDQTDRLATLKVTGTFFSGAGDVTYDMAFDGYGKAVVVRAP